jgi:hypothetical protein
MAKFAYEVSSDDDVDDQRCENNRDGNRQRRSEDNPSPKT